MDKKEYSRKIKNILLLEKSKPESKRKLFYNHRLKHILQSYYEQFQPTVEETQGWVLEGHLSWYFSCLGIFLRYAIVLKLVLHTMGNVQEDCLRNVIKLPYNF